MWNRSGVNESSHVTTFKCILMDQSKYETAAQQPHVSAIHCLFVPELTS